MTRLLTHIALLLALLTLGSGCERKPDRELISETLSLLDKGELTRASEAAAKLSADPGLSVSEKRLLDSVTQICERIKIDFCQPETVLLKKLEHYRPGIKSSDLAQLENQHKFDFRVVDGEKKFFKNSVRNLFLLDSAWHRLKSGKDGREADSLDGFRLRHSTEVIRSSSVPGDLVQPVKMTLSYRISVAANAVPAGETIRCWMPFPREGNSRQMQVKLLETNPSMHAVSPATDLQRSIYLEKKAEENQPTLFETKLELTSYAQSFDISPQNIQPYRRESDLYRTHTAEKPPHILFTNKIKSLAKRILQDETNPLLQVKKIYSWINDSVKWASAVEYSILNDIPGFVIDRRHGDCGMQTLLFMTLARYTGIPVKWQSGWMLHPGYVNLHDWCEVYFEGIGWVPLDQSFGLQNSQDPRLRYFYATGIDAYRFIVNDDIAAPLTPVKNYLRSEPYDFQRGEIEWRKGNLYFEKWTWNMEVTYQEM
jgi:hypothetical protein